VKGKSPSIEGAAMSEKENMQVVQGTVTAFNQKDVEKLLSHYTDEATFADMAESATATGKAAIRDYLQGWLSSFPDARIEVVHRIGHGSHVVDQWKATGTHQGQFRGITPTARVVSVPLVCIFKLRRGMITNATLYYDAASILRQLGHLP